MPPVAIAGELNSEETTVWQRKASILRQAEVNTIRELVKRLKPGRGRPPAIEGISSADAAEMLTDIALSAIPIGRAFREAVVKRVGGTTNRLTFNRIKRILVSLSRTEFRDRHLTALFERNLRDITADPFQSDILLATHPLTASLFRDSIHGRIANRLGVAIDQVDRLLTTYDTESVFLSANSSIVAGATGIDLQTVERIKRSTGIASQLRVPIETAVALEASFEDLKELVYYTPEDLKQVLTSGSSIPENQVTTPKLRQIIQAAKNLYPEIAYFNQVVTDLNLPSQAHQILERLKAESFGDLRRYVPLEMGNKSGRPISAVEYLIEEGKLVQPQTIDSLRAHTRLEKVSKNLGLNKALIDAGVTSSGQLALIPVEQFRLRFGNTANAAELEEVHEGARNMMARIISLGARRTMTAQGNHLDRLIYPDEAP